MAFTIPPTLQRGDTIGVMAPSSYVERDAIQSSKQWIEDQGYKVFIHPQTYERHHQSAGTELQKALALQGLWQREDIKAIWAAGGGNRAGALLHTLNFDKMRGAPKALIGFSDVTCLLNAISTKAECVTYHGPVFQQIHNHTDANHALDALAGNNTEISLDSARVLNAGEVTGPLYGGCLSIFQTLIGTDFMPDMNGAILFLEDYGDHISRFDRMFIHLKNSGLLNKIGGLIIGTFAELQDGKRPFGFTMDHIITNFLGDTDIPVLLDAPFGHGQRLKTFPIGRSITLKTNKKTISATQP